MRNKDDIILGAGEVYVALFSGVDIPEDTKIETDANNIGHCSGGFSVDYKPTKYDVKNQYGQIVRSFITEEAITAKTGVLSWALANLQLLSTAEYTEDKTEKKRKLLFTGKGKALPCVLLRFVHEKENGKKLRFTMVGQGGSGFAIEFKQEELVIDAEITAIKKVDGFLASFDEELTDEEVAELEEEAVKLEEE